MGRDFFIRDSLNTLPESPKFRKEIEQLRQKEFDAFKKIIDNSSPINIQPVSAVSRQLRAKWSSGFVSSAEEDAEFFRAMDAAIGLPSKTRKFHVDEPPKAEDTKFLKDVIESLRQDAVHLRKMNEQLAGILQQVLKDKGLTPEEEMSDAAGI